MTSTGDAAVNKTHSVMEDVEKVITRWQKEKQRLPLQERLNRMMKESFSKDILFKLKKDRENCHTEGIFFYVLVLIMHIFFSDGHNFIF